MNNNIELLKDYTELSPLLSRIRFVYDHGPNPEDLIMGRRNEIVTTKRNQEAALDLAISKLVDDIEGLVLFNMDKGPSISKEELKESNDYVVSFVSTDLNVHTIFYGVAKDYYSTSISTFPTGELILLPADLGVITLHAGEAYDMQPGLWSRKGEQYVQAGIAFKVTELNCYRNIV